MIEHVSDIPVLGVGVGALMTLIVQSSSATIAVLQNFASTPGADGVTSIIGLAGAIPILLGDNIGTTITALLASIGQSRDAKRAAVAHSVFNISGAFLFIWFVKPYAHFIQSISPKGIEIEVISRQIANAHTGFNLTMTLIWLPLIPILVKIVSRIVSDRSNQNDVYEIAAGEVVYLDEKYMNQPAVALHQIAKEVLHCEDIVEEMLGKVRNLTDESEEHLAAVIQKDAAALENLYNSINEYVNEMYAKGVVTEDQAGELTRLMYLLCDTYRVGSLCGEITDTVACGKDTEIDFSHQAKKDLKKSVEVIYNMYALAANAVRMGHTDADDIQKMREKVMRLDDKMRKAHIDRVGKKQCNAKLTASFNNILHNIDRMSNSCVNIVEMTLTGTMAELMLTEETV